MTHGKHGMEHLPRIAWLSAALCGLAVLAGCVSTDPAPAAVDITPLSTQIGNLADANADLKAANARLEAANDALKEENEHLKAMLRADADAGRAANAKGWLPFERYVWDHQIALLPNAPDRPTADKWGEAAGLYEAGGESAMQGIINSLNDDAAAQNKRIGALQESIDNLTKERDDAKAAAEAALARVREAEATLAAAIEKARQDEAAAIRAEQVHKATQGGTICGTLALLFAAAAIFSPAAKLRFAGVAAFFAGAGITLFAAARWIGSTWFGWSVAAAWGIAGIVALVWMIRKGIEEREAKAKAARDGLVASVLVQKLNDFYNASDQAMKDALNNGLFAALEKAGTAYAVAVKQIKADNIAASTSSSTTTPPLAETAQK